MRILVLAALVSSTTAHAEPWRIVDIAAPGATRDAATAERAARAYLAAHRDDLAPGEADFVIAANRVDDELRTVAFRQQWRGLPVVGGQLGFVFARDRLIAIQSRAVPNIHPHGRGNVIITDHIATAVDAWPWRIYVDESGRELARESQIAHASATLAYNAGLRYAAGTRTDHPAPAAHVTVAGMAQTTGVDGSIAWTGASATTVTTGLSGSYVIIHNQAGALASATLTAQPGALVPWNLSSDELGDAQLSTYIYANAAKARARVVNPAVLAWLDQPTDFYVNEVGQRPCDAYSTGTDVHIDRGTTGQCENGGRVADVVYHEFAHSLHYHSIIPAMGAFDTSLSEGLADFFAANMLEDSGVGRGFHFDNTPLRDIDPIGVERRWPDDTSSDAHITGLIISGALWDVRKALITALGHDAGVAQTEAIFTGVMRRAADIPTSYVAALLADDDDGNLANGTPHRCAIVRAFGVHGLAGADFLPVEIGAPVFDGLAISVPVVSHADAPCVAPQLTSITVTWRVGDAVASTFSLTPGSDAWSGTFPDLPDGSVISYALELTFDDGESHLLPDNPADPLYQQYIGTAVPLYCAMMNSDPHWEQSGNFGNDWEFTRPLGEPAAPHTGIYVLGTDVGAGQYRPGELTAIVTPQVDVSAYRHVHLQYWRWLSIEAAEKDQAAIDINEQNAWNNAAGIAHVDKEWRFHDVDMTPFIGDDGLAQARWSLRSDVTGQLGGWRLDDVCLVGVVKKAVCGDGVLDDGEQCDDANLTSGDGCSAACIDELSAGGGGCATGRGGSLWIIAGAAALRAASRRDRSRRACRSTPADRADPRRS